MLHQSINHSFNILSSSSNHRRYRSASGVHWRQSLHSHRQMSCAAVICMSRSRRTRPGEAGPSICPPVSCQLLSICLFAASRRLASISRSVNLILLPGSRISVSARAMPPAGAHTHIFLHLCSFSSGRMCVIIVGVALTRINSAI